MFNACNMSLADTKSYLNICILVLISDTDWLAFLSFKVCHKSATIQEDCQCGLPNIYILHVVGHKLLSSPFLFLP